LPNQASQGNLISMGLTKINQKQMT